MLAQSVEHQTRTQKVLGFIITRVNSFLLNFFCVIPYASFYFSFVIREKIRMGPSSEHR